MITVTFRPLLVWDRPETPSFSRKRSPFATSFACSLRQLESEIRYLKGERVVVSGQFEERDIRNDGYPRADAKPAGPKISISFESKHGPLVFMCDDCVRWTDNLHAIALTLERLRLADRYGVTRTGEQYRGWKALPAPAADTFANFESALAWVSIEAGRTLTSAADFKTACRKLLKDFHPDLGGDAVKFRKLQNARALVEQNLGAMQP